MLYRRAAWAQKARLAKSTVLRPTTARQPTQQNRYDRVNQIRKCLLLSTRVQNRNTEHDVRAQHKSMSDENILLSAHGKEWFKFDFSPFITGRNFLGI